MDGGVGSGRWSQLAVVKGVSGQWSREWVVRMYGWSVGSGRWSQWAVVKGVGGADVWMELYGLQCGQLAMESVVKGVGGADGWIEVWAVGDGVSGQWSRELRVRMYRWGCMD
jgi:hypothetical protein